LNKIDLNQKFQLAAVCIDSNLLRASAVTQMFSLYALRNGNFYVIPSLSSTLSDGLNLPRASAIGLGEGCTEVLSFLQKNFQPIGISKAKKNLDDISIFCTPETSIPSGKGKKNRKKRTSLRK